MKNLTKCNDKICLTDRLTSRSDTQVGHSDPVIRYGTVIAQGIKVTLGINQPIVPRIDIIIYKKKIG